MREKRTKTTIKQMCGRGEIHKRGSTTRSESETQAANEQKARRKKQQRKKRLHEHGGDGLQKRRNYGAINLLIDW